RNTLFEPQLFERLPCEKAGVEQALFSNFDPDESLSLLIYDHSNGFMNSAKNSSCIASTIANDQGSAVRRRDPDATTFRLKKSLQQWLLVLWASGPSRPGCRPLGWLL